MNAKNDIVYMKRYAHLIECAFHEAPLVKWVKKISDKSISYRFFINKIEYVIELHEDDKDVFFKRGEDKKVEVWDLNHTTILQKLASELTKTLLLNNIHLKSL